MAGAAARVAAPRAGLARQQPTAHAAAAAAPAPPAERARTQPRARVHVRAVLRRFWHDVDTAALLADFGFAPRMALSQRTGPAPAPAPAAGHARHPRPGRAVPLLFPRPTDADWLDAIDDAHAATPGSPTLARRQRRRDGWRSRMTGRRSTLSWSARCARAGFLAALRPRMSRELLVDEPVPPAGARAPSDVREAARGRRRRRCCCVRPQYLRALLDTLPPARRQRRRAPRGPRRLGGHRVRARPAARAHAAHRAAARLRAEHHARHRDARGCSLQLVRTAGRAPQHARAVGAALLAAGAQGGRAQRRDRRALHHPRPRRLPRACCGARPAAARCSPAPRC